MKNYYQRMMEQVSLDETAKARMEEKISRGARTSRRVPLRPVLAAACVCMVLVGGAFAGSGISGVLVGRQQSSAEEASYRVQAELGQWKIGEMGQQLRADLTAGDLQKTFDDREDLEDYLGVSLAHSALLENAGIVENLADDFAYGWDLRPELLDAPDARYVLTGDGAEGEPEVLKVTAHRVVDNAEVFLDARIITEYASEAELENGLVGENFGPQMRLTVDFVYDENGEIQWDENGEAVLDINTYRSAERYFESSEYEMANGLTATIVVVADSMDEGGNMTGREYIGHFVSDGILYTVRPYAIYNPNMSFPMHDSDMLIVLKTVLDSFS